MGVKKFKKIFYHCHSSAFPLQTPKKKKKRIKTKEVKELK